MSNEPDERTFVYEGKEWTITGRQATKPIFHKRRVNATIGHMTMVEIAPTGPAASDTAFYKWVDPRELFYITEVNSTEIDVERLKKTNDEVSCEND